MWLTQCLAIFLPTSATPVIERSIILFPNELQNLFFQYSDIKSIKSTKT